MGLKILGVCASISSCSLDTQKEGKEGRSEESRDNFLEEIAG